MKRAFKILGAIALIAVIAFLGVTRHLSLQRAAKLDREWLEAQSQLMEKDTRIMELEGDLQAAKAQVAELAKSQAPAATTTTTSAAGGPPTTAASTPSTTAQPAAGTLIRYAATAAPGLTNTVRIEGTSTVHDWQVEGHMIGGSAEFPAGFPPLAGAEPRPGPIAAKASAFIPVRSLKSIEKDGGPYSDPMDEIMYGKLLAETNRRITYTLTSLTPKPQPGSTNASFEYEATGNLSVAGVTNTITMPVTIAPGPGGKLQIAGSVKTKMTDFKITPPSPSLPGGISIKTGDDITLRFNWWVNPLRPLEAAK